MQFCSSLSCICAKVTASAAQSAEAGLAVQLCCLFVYLSCLLKILLQLPCSSNVRLAIVFSDTSEYICALLDLSGSLADHSLSHTAALPTSHAQAGHLYALEEQDACCHTAQHIRHGPDRPERSASAGHSSAKLSLQLIHMNISIVQSGRKNEWPVIAKYRP